MKTISYSYPYTLFPLTDADKEERDMDERDDQCGMEEES